MAVINVANVLNMLLATFQVTNIGSGVVPLTSQEIELHDALKDMIVSAHHEDIFSFEHVTGLEFERLEEPHEAQFVEDVAENEEDDYEDIACVPEEGGSVIGLDYKIKAVQYWKSGTKKRLSVENVKHKFRKVKSLGQLYRWEESIDRGGTHTDKLRFITEYVLTKFENSVDDGKIIHDMDLRRWALEAKQEIGHETFKAGHWWIWHFKKVHNIVSRKITKFITRSTRTGMEELQLVSNNFINEVKPHVISIGRSNVYNADESGFNLEVHSGRTLAVKGQKTVEGVVQSLSSITHSYTILPAISADGRLISPLFLVLKESTDTFGPRVAQSLFRPINVYISSSTSGKLTSNHFKTWLTDVFFPNIGPNSVLLIDSWSGHCVSELQKLVPKNKSVKILNIPKKTTAMIQPLDVFGFRLWKNFVRTFSDTVILMNYDIDLHQRNNIIKLQSLTHNQFSSPRFFEVFKYSWYKSGYVDERPGSFKNPVEFCFAKDVESTPLCSVCNKPAILRCSWCKQYLCFQHFYTDYHYCNKYIE